MELLRAASEEHAWGIDRAECARVWQGGCIIRAAFLGRIQAAFAKNPALPNLMVCAPSPRVRPLTQVKIQ
jgi:6-phosphogluconate dehydrogenase